MERNDDYLVEKIGDKKIKITYRNSEAEEGTKIVDLSKETLKPIKKLSLRKE